MINEVDVIAEGVGRSPRIWVMDMASYRFKKVPQMGYPRGGDDGLVLRECGLENIGLYAHFLLSAA